MKSITVWIFDNQAAAQGYAQNQINHGNIVAGPVKLGNVNVVDRSGNNPNDRYFVTFTDKWGIVVVG